MSVVTKLSVGPLVGHTTDNKVRIWGRGIGKDNFICHGIAHLFSETGTLIESKWFRMLPHFDYTGIVDFNNLTASTNYIYRIGYVHNQLKEDDLADTSDYSFSSLEEYIVRTSLPQNQDDISFIVGSCRYMHKNNDGGRSDKAFRSINMQIDARIRTDCILMIGDQIYADMGEGKDANTYEEFTKKYQTSFGSPHIKKLMGRCPTYMAMDDHEITNNWSMDKLYEGSDYDIEKNQKIYSAAMSAYESYQLIHSPAFNRSGDSQVSDSPKHRFYNFNLGSSRFFVMDVRTEKYIKLKMMIGSEQMSALKLWLMKNKEKLKFVVSAVPFFPDIPHFSKNDRWTGFLEQRKEILDFIVNNGIKRVVFLGGDVHRSIWSTLVHEPSDIKINSIVSSAFHWWIIPSPPVVVWDKTGPLRGAKDFVVKSSEGFINEYNFTRITREGDSLKVQVYHRKGKLLQETNVNLV